MPGAFSPCGALPAAMVNAAETARQQGVDLYGEASARLRAGLEFHADYLLGKMPPAWLCGGKLDLRILPMWEIAFNHSPRCSP